jgi:hypothetical protein
MKRLLLLVLFAAFASSFAGASPISCSVDMDGLGPGFSCDLYHITGNLSDDIVASAASAPFRLPNTVVAGYVVILHSATDAPNLESNWATVLHFIDDGRHMGTAETLEVFYDDGCNASFDVNGCFPSYSTVLSSANVFMSEQDFLTTYLAFPNTYRIHYGENPSDGGATVPEPPELALTGLGLIGLWFGLRRRISKISARQNPLWQLR